jgi:CRP-like cAMP-binding protein
VLSNVGDMVRSADARIMDLSTLSAINRVHTELLRMAKADDNVGVIKPIPTHSEIAARASTTRETVSRVLSHLARICIMERTARELRVLDLDRLKDLIEPAND